MQAQKKAVPAGYRTASQNYFRQSNYKGLDGFLSHLEKVRRTGPGTWIACCPAHEDRRPSLNIREADDGKILVHCYAGCEFSDIVAAVGMDQSDLFPPGESHHHKPERRPFPASDALRVISFEALVVAVSGRMMLDGRALTSLEQDRLLTAVERINAALAASGVRHG